MLLDQIEKLAKDYGLTRLSAESNISRPHIHRILAGRSSPSLETLTKLLTILGYGLMLAEGTTSHLDLTKIEDLKFAMAHYGAPLIISVETKEAYKNYSLPDLESVLLHAVRKGRSSAEINSVLPFFIHKNIADLDFGSLIDLYDDRQYLGYLFDLLYKLTSERKYIMAISKLNIDVVRLRTKTLMKGRPKNKFRMAFFNRIINPVAKSWKFRTGDSFDNIMQRFAKWSGIDLYQEKP